MEAQTFATRQLKELAAQLSCPLPQRSETFRCAEITALPIVVEYDEAGAVRHLGLALFSKALKADRVRKPLYDFQERLFLETFLQKDEDKARRVLGQYSTLFTENRYGFLPGTYLKSLEESLFLAKEDGVEYELMKDSLTWSSAWRSGGRSFVIRFPANHDVIMGMDKNEAEQWLATQLQSFSCEAGDSLRSLEGQLGELRKSKGANYVLKGEALFTKGMNRDIYFQPLYDRNYPAETAINLFTYPDPVHTRGISLQIRQVVYGGQTITYNMPLSDFQCFMGNDFDTYVGIVKADATTLKFTVIYKSRVHNFNHLLSIDTSPESLFDRKTPLKAVMNSFIPNQNIKNLFKEYNPTGEANL
jgi:hypothetical protein